jgi:hypothetical protein
MLLTSASVTRFIHDVPTCKKLLPILRNEIKFLVESPDYKKKNGRCRFSMKEIWYQKTVSNTLARHCELKIKFLAANEEVTIRRKRNILTR